MSSINQIYNSVRSLPVADRLRLVERVVHDVVEASGSVGRQGGERLLGLFADDPALVDEVCRQAFEDRTHRTLRSTSG